MNSVWDERVFEDRSLSAGLEDQDGVAEARQVEEGEHVQVVVESSSHVLADDGLPLALPCPEVGLIALEVLDQVQADVLLQDGIRPFAGILQQLRGF